MVVDAAEQEAQGAEKLTARDRAFPTEASLRSVDGRDGRPHIILYVLYAAAMWSL